MHYVLEEQYNNPAIFHPDQIWNVGIFGFFDERHANNKIKKNKMSSDMISVPDPKMLTWRPLCYSTSALSFCLYG